MAPRVRSACVQGGLIRSCACRGARVTEHTVCPCITREMKKECNEDLPQ